MKAKLQDFQIIEKLGEGGNAEVFLVKRTSDQQELALKQLKKNNRGKEKKIRFIQEAKIMLENYPLVEGILPILDFSEEEYWYTMPIAIPAIQYIERNKLDIQEIVHYTEQLCDTLIYLHEKEISHRDIKPSNIYFYNEKFCFGDFGLVDFPNNTDGFTRSDKGLGAIFTIAPEMKRNPKEADGKKADVFSLAKTLWMFLTNDEKGFDGVYNYADSNHGLHNFEQYRNVHLVELEQLLTESTDNDPEKRPTVKEFKKRLIEWERIYSDYDASQASDWNFLNTQLFGQAPADSSSWSNRNVIVDVLNIVGKTPAYNHMFFHDKGGMDFLSAQIAAEDGCIKLYDTQGICRLVKPKKLYFEGFGDNYRWNYFLLELDNLEPVDKSCVLDEEYLVEDRPAHYVSGRYAQYGVYDYDEGTPLPDGYEVLLRYIKGQFLIVMKFGPYNKINSTYDGRHGDCSPEVFRTYISKLIDLFSEIYTMIKNNGLLENESEENIEESILNLPQFEQNPFGKYEHDKALEFIHSDTTFDSEDFIQKNIIDFDFGTSLPLIPPQGDSKLKFVFVFDPPSVNFDSIEELFGRGYRVCKNGKIQCTDSPHDEQCYCVFKREDTKKIIQLLNETVFQIIEEKGFQKLSKDFSCFSAELVKIGKPNHLFSKKEIEDLMRSADDRVNNQLVIDENGYAKIVNCNEDGILYPVRHEIWGAGNLYVGKYSKLQTLNDNYLSSLQGWLLYLQTGEKQYVDYVDSSNSDEQELIKKIKTFY